VFVCLFECQHGVIRRVNTKTSLNRFQFSCTGCRCINNASPAFPSNFKKALEEFDVNEDGLIDYGEFGQIDARYPLVLFPAFRLQDVMQRNSLGKNTSHRCFL
jgi:hypothetical protein